MAEPKWTPGPWHHEEVEPLKGQSAHFFIRSDEKEIGHTVTYDCNLNSRNNAQLIAAAPDLDASCDPEALIALAGRARQNGCPGLAGELLLLADKQRAAKAKARGEVKS